VLYYKVYRGASGAQRNFVADIPINGMPVTYVDATAPANRLMCYHVVAVETGGSGQQQSPASGPGCTPVPQSALPGGMDHQIQLMVTPGMESSDLLITRALMPSGSPVTHIVLYRSDDLGSHEELDTIQLAPDAAWDFVTYHDAGLRAAHVYSYVAVAITKAEEAIDSDERFTVPYHQPARLIPQQPSDAIPDDCDGPRQVPRVPVETKLL
jgi:hypothetical protein